jgi:hypothetical protein
MAQHPKIPACLNGGICMSTVAKALLVAAALIGSGANAAVISGTGDPLTDPALAGGTQITFDNVQTLPFTESGVTFTAVDTVPIAVGGYFATEVSFGNPVVTFTFDQPVSAVAFNVLDDLLGIADPWTFSIFSNGSLLESVLLAPGSFSPGEYVGLSGTNITSATLGRDAGSSSNILIDNLTFTAVPEPSTWAMMLLGFGAIGFAIRRKRAVVLAPF